MEITLHTGLQDDNNRINIDWFDENGVHYTNVLEINIEPMDKPRTLSIVFEGIVLANVTRKGMTLR